MTHENKPKFFKPGVGNLGMTALHFAAYRADMNELRRALDAGADPNVKDDYLGYTAIHWLADMAANGGPRVQMLRLLVERGADTTLTANDGTTAMALAAGAGSVTGEQLLEELSKI